MITISDLRQMVRGVKPDALVNVSIRMPDGTVLIGESCSVSRDNFDGPCKVTVEASKTSEFKGSWVFYPDDRLSALESVAQVVSMIQGVAVSADLAAAARDALKKRH